MGSIIKYDSLNKRIIIISPTVVQRIKLDRCCTFVVQFIQLLAFMFGGETFFPFLHFVTSVLLSNVCVFPSDGNNPTPGLWDRAVCQNCALGRATARGVTGCGDFNEPTGLLRTGVCSVCPLKTSTWRSQWCTFLPLNLKFFSVRMKKRAHTTWFKEKKTQTRVFPSYHKTVN